MRAKRTDTASCPCLFPSSDISLVDALKTIADFDIKNNITIFAVSLLKIEKTVKQNVQGVITNNWIMAQPCENCKLRAHYDKNPKSIMGRFWRWHINFCPGWKGYFTSLNEEEKAVLREKYNFKKYQ